VAILSRFARDGRVHEIEGCPLVPGDGGSESACATCPFNVLKPGASRVGCVVSTSFAAYERALEQLARIDPAGKSKLEAILEVERTTANDIGLDDASLSEIEGIAKKWWPLVGNDLQLQQVVAAMMVFSRAGLRTKEPVRILV
jgi:hypothetical protein